MAVSLARHSNGTTPLMELLPMAKMKIRWHFSHLSHNNLMQIIENYELGLRKMEKRNLKIITLKILPIIYNMV